MLQVSQLVEQESELMYPDGNHLNQSWLKGSGAD
jgi:hypothetical protein